MSIETDGFGTIYKTGEGGGGGGGGGNDVFVYQPNGVSGGNVYVDPWLLYTAMVAIGLGNGTAIVHVFVDCTYESPAPWPVDQLICGAMFHASPGTNAPAILGLMNGTNPNTSAPSLGALYVPLELDNVLVLNINSTSEYMVYVGAEFSTRLTLRNNASIQRSGDFDIFALGIFPNSDFTLYIDKCSDPFSNLVDSGTWNTQVNGGVGDTLNVVVTNALPIDLTHPFQLPSFASSPGPILNIFYDGTVPASALDESAWPGTVNLVSLIPGGGDISSVAGITRVVGAMGLLFDPISFATPPPGGVFTWDGTKIVIAVPGTVPTVGITSWVVTPSTVEVGATFNPTGTASYSGTPDSATVQRVGHIPPQTLSAPYTSWSYGTPISISTVLGTEVFVLSALFGSDNKTASGQVVAGARIYYGASSDPGTYDAAFAIGLGANNLQTSLGITAQMDTGTLLYGFMVIPVAFGVPSAWFVYPNPGSPLFSGGVIQVGVVTVPTNGVNVDYNVYRTFNFGQGSINMKAT